LKIEKIEHFQEPETSSLRGMLAAFMFVKPGNLRLLKEGKLLWSGKVQVVPETRWGVVFHATLNAL
jgi:hypothetical protein